MSTINKLTALLICLVILCGFVVSCTTEQPDNGSVGEQPDNNTDDDINFPTDEYVATVTVTFNSDDAKMKDAIGAMGETVYTVTADEANLQIVSNAAVGDISIDETYTYLESTLYKKTTLGVGDKSASSYEKATMSEADRNNLLDKIGPGASIEKNDFLKVDISKSGNYTTYTCTKINSTSADSLADVFESKFAGTGATVKLESASYTIVLLGDANSSFDLSCNFIVTMDGVDYSVTMNMSCEYDYKSVSISAPENAENYVDVSLSDIIG